MFGFFDAIYGFLTRQMGTRGDAANSSGSLHAKVSSIQNDISTKPQRARSGKYTGTVSTTSTTEVSMLSVSGKGRLVALRLRISSTSTTSQNFNVRILIDGVQIASWSLSSPSGTNGTVLGWPSIYAMLTSANYTEIDLSFNGSFELRGYVTGATSYTGYIDYVYELE
ncbi:hypothetical protein [Effusibacillus dendaii]|uniref:Uncharacterized protein n=1 Tax=Effusibacillus dendaii TaxID=2743772 RepID=A0A7I8D8G7_9BACL|nr:hypothetical protein [Effusibacillus dendaii]BCJ86443.1 hypothetical protein skT53_14280 [Effusibacillus dendaii]